MFSNKIRIKWFAIILLMLSISSTLRNIEVESKLQNENTQIQHGQVTLTSYSYHNVTIYVTKGQAISGDWEAKPADVVSPPFLVFIVDATNFEKWKNSDNLTQAVNRIPGENLLYLYDPFFKLDDIPLDGRRSGTIQVKAPYTDNWTLVMYSGASGIPLIFTWHLDVFEGYLVDFVMWGLVGLVALGVLITTITIYVKRKRVPEDEVSEILRIRDEILEEQPPDSALGSLEEVGEEQQEFEV